MAETAGVRYSLSSKQDCETLVNVWNINCDLAACLWILVTYTAGLLECGYTTLKFNRLLMVANVTYDIDQAPFIRHLSSRNKLLHGRR